MASAFLRDFVPWSESCARREHASKPPRPFVGCVPVAPECLAVPHLPVPFHHDGLRCLAGLVDLGDQKILKVPVVPHKAVAEVSRRGKL